jgi:hypothetical protein
MTDEETVEAILDEAFDRREMSDARDPVWLRAELLRLLRTARQPVAHEVPGFHIDSGGGVALWTVEYGSWAAIQPGDFQLFDQRRVVGDGAIPSKWSDIKPEDFRTYGVRGDDAHA